METQEALNIRDSLVLLKKALNINFDLLVSRICFCDDKNFNILKEASDIWNEFEKSNIVKRGEMLGIKITLNNTSNAHIDINNENVHNC